jgi:hypothetical protein
VVEWAILREESATKGEKEEAVGSRKTTATTLYNTARLFQIICSSKNSYYLLRKSYVLIFAAFLCSLSFSLCRVILFFW